MKILAYVGSPRGMGSNTYQLTKKILDKVCEKASSKVEYEIITAEKLELKHCRGCTNCFDKGSCPLDKIDGFDSVKNKLEGADMVILSTPVHAHTVTAGTKVFIDRLAYWLHLMKLAGKPAVTIVTSSSNGYKETTTYLKKIVQIWGAEVIANIMCTVDAPRLIDDERFNEEVLPVYIQLMCDYLDGEKMVKSTEFHEAYFKHLKESYDVPYDLDHAELKYWRASGYLKCENYEKMLELIRSKKKETIFS